MYFAYLLDNHFIAYKLLQNTGRHAFTETACLSIDCASAPSDLRLEMLAADAAACGPAGISAEWCLLLDSSLRSVFSV